MTLSEKMIKSLKKIGLDPVKFKRLNPKTNAAWKWHVECKKCLVGSDEPLRNLFYKEARLYVDWGKFCKKPSKEYYTFSLSSKREPQLGLKIS